MNILITGANGFIGKNFINLMKMMNQDNQLILLTSRKIDGFNCIQHKDYNFTVEDFTDNNVKYIDAVIHLGAFTPKSSTYANDIKNCNLNIYNTEHLINNLPSVPKKFIYISSIDVYQNSNSIITENTPTIPQTLYGYSKLYCEKMLEEWARKEQVIIQILRLGHVYGNGEEEYQKIIPECIKTVMNNEPPLIYTYGTERRSFVNVKDVCKLIINSIQLTQYVGPINITSSDSINIIDLVNMIIEISGKNLKPKRKNNVNKSRDVFFDNSKMRSVLGQEEMNLLEGLKEEYYYFLSKRRA